MSLVERVIPPMAMGSSGLFTFHPPWAIVSNSTLSRGESEISFHLLLGITSLLIAIATPLSGRFNDSIRS